MKDRRVGLLLPAVAIGAAFVMNASSRPAQAQGVPRNKTIIIRDDCDPDDPNWAPTGGCTLRKGDVDTVEFDVELASPLSLSVIGHQAWRNDPSYLKIETDQDVKVRNYGGRTHTFTEVAEFGGGRVPPLNMGLTPAPECATAANIAPRANITVSGLSEGNHRFQCCIHPWMRALIKVKADDGKKDR
jgi:plastocyanin